MQNSLTFEVSCFGALRRYTNGRKVIVVIPAGTPVREFRKYLGEELRKASPEFLDEGLIMESAFADDEAVLDDDMVPTKGGMLAVLPPVCGG